MNYHPDGVDKLTFKQIKYHLNGVKYWQPMEWNGSLGEDFPKEIPRKKGDKNLTLFQCCNFLGLFFILFVYKRKCSPNLTL